ncbi:DUF4430 domain-containing protein [Mycoplasmatota bacterium]|nr:DUF4430 domain-containing protein [Mycoplasmatota bacterium]
MFKNKKLFYGILSSVVMVLIAVALIWVYNSQNSRKDVTTTDNGMMITVKVIVDDEVKLEKEIKTEEELLWDAIKDEGIIEADESQYGHFVTTAAGITVDSEKQQWWFIEVNGEGAAVGIDDLNIYDKDVIVFELKTGW